MELPNLFFNLHETAPSPSKREKLLSHPTKISIEKRQIGARTSNRPCIKNEKSDV